jgi:hypothetical protein
VRKHHDIAQRQNCQRLRVEVRFCNVRHYNFL